MAQDTAFSALLARKIFNALSAHIAVIDVQGRILETNAAWKDFSRKSGGPDRFQGINYLQICESAGKDRDAAQVAHGIRGVIDGRITEFCHDYPCHSPEGPQWFYMRAVRMADPQGVRVIISHENITELKLAQEGLRERQAELEAHKRELETQNQSLEDANAALRVLIRQRDADLADEREKIRIHIQTLVMPHVRKLKAAGLKARDQSLVAMVEEQLGQAVSPTRLSGLASRLTPQEMQVAVMVREGRSTAEIADALFVAEATVSFHRKNLRQKLGLKARQDNLRSFLLSLT